MNEEPIRTSSWHRALPMDPSQFFSPLAWLLIVLNLLVGSQI